MKLKKIFYLPILTLIVISCGSENEPVKPTTFYKKENVTTKQLELSIETSGIIEAI